MTEACIVIVVLPATERLHYFKTKLSIYSVQTSHVFKRYTYVVKKLYRDQLRSPGTRVANLESSTRSFDETLACFISISSKIYFLSNFSLVAMPSQALRVHAEYSRGFLSK